MIENNFKELIMKICIIYGSTTGVTEEIASKVAKELSADVFNCAEVAKASDYQLVVLATSTWGDGDLQDDWDSVLDALRDVDFSGKKVALIGVGDQESYPDTFINGIRDLYDIAASKGATLVGQTSTDGYDYSDSTAIENGMFLGLVIDENNQSDLTDKRISDWVASIK